MRPLKGFEARLRHLEDRLKLQKAWQYLKMSGGASGGLTYSSGSWAERSKGLGPTVGSGGLAGGRCGGQDGAYALCRAYLNLWRPGLSLEAKVIFLSRKLVKRKEVKVRIFNKF